jgi:hypothetical protein
MDLLLLQLLASYGVCFGLMNEKVPALNRALCSLPLLRRSVDGEEPTTFFERMFSCAYCTGFHTGWMVWGTFVISGVGSPTQALIGLPAGVLFSFASGAFCYSLDTWLQWLER